MTHTRRMPALGILVCERDGNPPFAEGAYLRRLFAIGSKLRLSLFAFAPWTWNPGSDTVKGWTWDAGEHRWVTAPRKLPGVLYDRSWPANEAERRRYRQGLQTIVAAKKPVILNSRLPHKAKIYALLSRDPRFAEIVPPTAMYEGPASLGRWLRAQRQAAFLKPVAGSQGKRVVAFLGNADGSATLVGRTNDNRSFSVTCRSKRSAALRLHRWIGHLDYLMQPMLDLRGPAGEPFDVRALMQKNESGRWNLTGVAARCGRPDTVTSNLHGGGRALSAENLLSAMFGTARQRELLAEIGRYSMLLAEWLESAFGRFTEIGLDYGIDRSGKLWFLEANAKPGRAAMAAVSDDTAKRQADELPLSYARSILLRSSGRVIHEFDHL